MDRRYKESRFYNNVKVSNKGVEGAERLLSQYKQRANAENRQAQTYGGSTGGRKSTDMAFGRKVLGERASIQKEQGKIFDREGRGEYGARKVFGETYVEGRNPGGTGSLGSVNTGPKRYTGNIFDEGDK